LYTCTINMYKGRTSIKDSNHVQSNIIQEEMDGLSTEQEVRAQARLQLKLKLYARI